jgi:hypothetical protein
MRNLIPPPPSIRCDRCTGELRLKQIEAASPVLNKDLQIFVCANCDHEQSFAANRDHYSPRRDQRGSDVR